MSPGEPLNLGPKKSLLWSWGRMIVAFIAIVSFWGALVAAGTLYGWLRRPLAPRGDAVAFAQKVKTTIEQENLGNVAFVLMENGRVVDQYFVSRGAKVDADTLFQVASLSKWITAWGVMKLAEQGKIDLDAPVSRYLTRWRLPEGTFDNSQVTIRRLLSHTAGLTDGLGYGGFQPNKPVQSLEASLTQAIDAPPGADGRVRVGAQPGEGWNYSGGGYALLQLIVEEVAQQPFNSFMSREVFQPLGMTRSTFVLSGGEANIAESFDAESRKTEYLQFSAPAAASLYTSAADLSRFVQANMLGANGEVMGRGILGPQQVAEMQQPHAYQYGEAIWGLGVVLYAPNNRKAFVFGHDGSNAPAINTAARIDPATSSAIIVLATGQKRLATTLGGDWVFWKTGNVDLFDVLDAIRPALKVFVLGSLVILVGFIGFVVKRSRDTRTVS